MKTTRFFLVHLIGSDGAQLASEIIWPQDPAANASTVAPDAAQYFTADDHGLTVEQVQAATLEVYGAFQIGEPQKFKATAADEFFTDDWTVTLVQDAPAFGPESTNDDVLAAMTATLVSLSQELTAPERDAMSEGLRRLAALTDASDVATAPDAVDDNTARTFSNAELVQMGYSVKFKDGRGFSGWRDGSAVSAVYYEEEATGWDECEADYRAEECTCAARSWHGDHHDTACALNGLPRI